MQTVFIQVRSAPDFTSQEKENQYCVTRWPQEAIEPFCGLSHAQSLVNQWKNIQSEAILFTIWKQQAPENPQCTLEKKTSNLSRKRRKF